MYQRKKIKGPTEWADITELNLRYGEQPKQVPRGMWMGSVYLAKGKARGFSTPNSKVVQESKGSRSFECTAPDMCHAGDSSDKEPGVKQPGDGASLLPTVTNTNTNKPQSTQRRLNWAIVRHRKHQWWWPHILLLQELQGEEGCEAGAQLTEGRGPAQAEHFNAATLSLGEKLLFFPPLWQKVL